jgi:fructan beta-fructosidase
MRMCAILFTAVLTVGGAAAGEERDARDDIVVADFEGSDYGDWRVSGEAFGVRPARGTLPRQMTVSGYRGEGLVNSFSGGDRSVGMLVSPVFTVRRDYLRFLIGGGKYPGRTAVNLLVGGRIVRTATGPNDRPGGSERLSWHAWDVAAFEGEEAKIQIVDRVTRPWGHINVDHIVQSDHKAEPGTRRELVVGKRYLNLPVRTGAPKQRMRVLVEGEVVREFDIELAEREPEFWVFLDLTPFMGETITLEVDGLPEHSRGLHLVGQADEIRGTEDLYRETYRPQFHFTSRRGWNNDSNGLVFFKGEYHLYYQHNPYGVKWGNMHWGHAVSEDLVHWRELPIAVYPKRYGDWAFSGSAVVDVNDTAGFQTGEEPPIVIAWTSTGRGECIAYSNDRGRTFTEYEGNPVVEHRGRDPKVIWYEPGEHWVMAVYHEAEGERTIAFYTSGDLKEWEYASRIEGFYECPEIFPLAVDGQAGERRWVLYAADGDYVIGEFDGREFTPESGKHRFSYGNCFYASQTYSDVPPEDGRRIQIAWGRVEMPGMPFNQMMLFPVELTLRPTGDGPRMFARPVREIERLYERSRTWEGISVPRGRQPVPGAVGELFHVRAAMRTGGLERLGFVVRGVEVMYDVNEETLNCLERTAPLPVEDGVLEIELLVDRTSIEIFAGDGRIYMPIGTILPDDDRQIRILAEPGPVRIDRLELHRLHPIWPDPNSPSTP